MTDFMYSTSTMSLKSRFFLLIIVVLGLLFGGMFFYHSVEKWSYIDSLYFSTISLTTRGYGELHPTTVGSKLFTMLYLLLGVVLVLYLFSSLIGYFIQHHEPAIRKKMDSFIKTVAPPKQDKWVMIKVPPKKGI